MQKAFSLFCALGKSFLIMTKESSPKSDYLKSIMEKSIGENPASNRIIPIEKKIVENKDREKNASARETALECGPNPSDLKNPKQAEPTDKQLQAFREVEGLKFVKGLLC